MEKLSNCVRGGLWKTSQVVCGVGSGKPLKMCAEWALDRKQIEAITPAPTFTRNPPLFLVGNTYRDIFLLPEHEDRKEEEIKRFCNSMRLLLGAFSGKC